MGIATVTAASPSPATGGALPERTARFLAASRRRVAEPIVSTKQADWTHAYFELYAGEPPRRRQALAFAHALRQAPVLIFPGALLVGQTYHHVPGAGSCDSEGFGSDPRWQGHAAVAVIRERVARELPDLWRLNGREDGSHDPQGWLTGLPTAPGHIGWHWDWILAEGVEGLLGRIAAARPAADAEGREVLEGMAICLQALLDWADRHVAELERCLAQAAPAEAEELRSLLEICRHVPRQGARSFREALQAFHLSYLATMFENPHGGNGPGRLDYYLWPYLEPDLASGRQTLASARVAIDELFIRFHERYSHRHDGSVETIVVGGCRPDGSPFYTPLSRLLVESIGALQISHPSVYIRVPEEAPPEIYRLAAADLLRGGNRAQILSDRAILKAMTRDGAIPLADARMYMCGGCMELSPHGQAGDLLFTGFFNTALVLELVLNGGRSLNTGALLLPSCRTTLADFASFEELYAAFAARLEETLRLSFRCMDIVSEEFARHRPRFLVSSQVEDCIARGRTINAGGARYEDYGSTPLGIPNLGDSLSALKAAVYDQHFVSAAELLAALRANFAGHEALQTRLRALPKFGQGDAAADAMAQRVAATVCACYHNYRNRFGRRIKPMVMTFMMAPVAGRGLGASPDGRAAGTPIAQGLTPQSHAMTRGLTTAMLSANSLPLELFAGGASSMWDLDPGTVDDACLTAVLQSFLATGGQMFQGNATAVAELRRARQEPDAHAHLLVRVGGFSARFVSLSPELQDEIINRLRHRC